jgi:hypothetical protein
MQVTAKEELMCYQFLNVIVKAKLRLEMHFGVTGKGKVRAASAVSVDVT